MRVTPPLRGASLGRIFSASALTHTSTTARSILSLIASTAIGLSACGGEQPVPLASIVDSAGVQIVTSARPRWEADDSWLVEEEPSIEIPSDFGDPEHYLLGAHHVQRMDDGRLLVGNRDPRQLLAFDSLGGFLGPIGRPGQGPGETERVFGLFSCAADTIVVDEGSRISIWDSDFNFVRTERTAGRLLDSGNNIRAVSDDCSAGLFPDLAYEPPSAGQGAVRLSASLHWATLDGLSRDTVAEFLGVELYPWTINGESTGTRLPFGKDAVWATFEDQTHLGLQDDFEIQTYGRRGRLLRIARWEAAHQLVTDDDIDFFADGLRRRNEQYPEEAFIYAPADHFRFPSLKPTYSRLLTDDEGNLWVQQYGPYNPYEPETDPDWWVFDSAGQWLGEVVMPPGLAVITIQDGFVIGRVLDELDVEAIRLHRIDKR